MKQRAISLLLVLALIFSLCAVSALAEEQSGGESAAGPVTTDETTDTPPAEEPEDAPQVSLAGPDRPTTDLGEAVTIVPDAVGSLSFANLERRMRENSLQVLLLQENIDTLEDIDYDETAQMLREQLSGMAEMQWGLQLFGKGDGNAAYQLEQNAKSVRETLDAIYDGEQQQDDADTIRNLKNLQDQIIMAGESLYVAIAAMEIQEESLVHTLEATERTAQEMQLRYDLGQISALQLAEVSSGKASLESSLETLRMNIRTYKLQLEMLIGAQMDGIITLGPVPAVTTDEIGKMNLEEDLKTAKANSYELYAAEKVLEDEKDTYKEIGLRYHYNEHNYYFALAQHTWNSAQLTYNDTVQNYEMKFRTLYEQVKDYKQVLDTAQVALACEETSFAAAQMRLQQGSISQNKFLEAQNELHAAEGKVLSAANDLFSAYNTYCWAVQHGILN